VASAREALEAIQQAEFDIALLDIKMPGMDGMELQARLRDADADLTVIMMTGYASVDTAVQALKRGAYDYITKPVDPDELSHLVSNALEHKRARREVTRLRENLQEVFPSTELIGRSPAMKKVVELIEMVAPTEATVLITGESGTGKELVARGIYKHSHRAARPFIAVNCAAIPENLIESELFGHEKGSFTGATSQRIGKFELCDGGTIFLDEIGDMALAVQTKILRVLQEGEIQRVGGTETIKVDVRVLAATNKDLEEIVKARTFREDLYYRLNVVRIRMPPLRERLEDIPQVVDYMLQTLEKQRKTRVKKVSVEALAVLLRQRWPGNVRELENVIYRSAVIAQGDTILLKDLPPEIRETAAPVAISSLPAPSPVPMPAVPAAAPEWPPASTPAPVVSPAAARETPAPSPLSLNDALDFVYSRLKEEGKEPVLERLEREMITRVLKDENGNLVRASERLGITRTTLRKRIDAFGLRL
jgi:two-component system nitrogen regulation response regulator GlnG